tara:strand:+ start:1060 stop:1416 length:357 start_codon:yes stop_codon:yes gene_type:complete
MRTLIIGASINKVRYSYKAIQKLRKLNFDVCALGLCEGEVMDVKIQTNPIYCKEIHTVSIYLRPEKQFRYLNYVVKLAPKRVIFNPGSENEILMNKLKEKKIRCENSCTLVLLSTNQY